MIKMKANDRTFEVNGKKVENDVPPLNINDRTYVPVRFVSEHMGLNVDWDEKTETVTLEEINGSIIECSGAPSKGTTQKGGSFCLTIKYVLNF